jgi:hypothetical protein
VTTVAEFSELIDAFEFASFGGGVKHRGYVDREAGSITTVGSPPYNSNDVLPGTNTPEVAQPVALSAIPGLAQSSLVLLAFRRQFRSAQRDRTGELCQRLPPK